MKQVFSFSCLVIVHVLFVSSLGAQKVGIGTSSPQYKLDVRTGSINTDSLYRINGFGVLRIPGTSNLFLGAHAGQINIGSNNTFGGHQSGYVNTTGTDNSFYGSKSGYSTYAGTYNSFFGSSAGYSNTTGFNNSFFGAGTGYSNTVGQQNSFFGTSGGYSNTSGESNSFFGESAGSNNTLGNQNSFIGRFSGYSNSSGSFNTAVGYNTLVMNTTGTYNTAVGYKSEVLSSGLINASALGANARVDCDHCMVLGSVNGLNGAFSTVKVGIGNTNPKYRLDVKGSINTDSSYRISSFSILSVPGTGNLLVGKNAGKSNTGADNTFVGDHAGFANLGGWSNSFLGQNAGASNTGGHSNSFYGYDAGASNILGVNNSFFGKSAGNSNTYADFNSFFGSFAGYANFGAQNSFFGNSAGHNNSTGAYNSFFGQNAGKNSTTGDENSFFGSSAGFANGGAHYNSFFGNSAGNSNTGNSNAFFGRRAGYINTTGSNNNFIGSYAGESNTTGAGNTAIGYGALTNNVTGSGNTGLGRNSEVNVGNLLNATAIGNDARVDCSNCMVLGSVSGVNTATSDVNVGIGHTNPSYPLTFAQATGDKISLWNDATASYGFGIQAGLLQIHGNVSSADIAFGYGNSTSFTERMRIKGSGNVGIGTSVPGYILDVNGRMRIRSGGMNGTSAGIWLNNNANNATLAFIGMEDDDYVGIYGAAGFQFKMNVTNGNVAVGLGDPTEKLTVHGNIRANGNICYTGTNGACSDIRYKTKLSPLTHALSKVLSLQGLYYFWRTDEFIEKEFSHERQIGFAAQDVEQLFPEIVQTDSNGYKAVDYGRLTPVLVEAIKEQQIRIDELEKRESRMQQVITDQQHQLSRLTLLIEQLMNKKSPQ